MQITLNGFSLAALIVAVLSLGSSLGAQCIDNILVNGDMSAYTAGSATPDSYYYYGDGAAMVVDDGTNVLTSATCNGAFCGVAQYVGTVTAGDTYTFSATVNVTSAAGAVGLAISWRDADTNANGGGGNEISAVYSANANAGDGSVTLTISGVAPAGATRAQVNTNWQNGTVDADDFCFVVAPPAEVEGCDGNLLANGTLDGGLGSWYTYGGNVSADAGGGVSGSGAVVIGVGANNGFGQNGIAVTPGETYLLRADAKLVAAGSFANLGVGFFDAAGDGINTVETAIVSADFATYTVLATAPSSAVTAQAIIAANGVEVVADNFFLLGGQPAPSSPPACLNDPENISLDGDFEDGTQWYNQQGTPGYGAWSNPLEARDVPDPASGDMAVRLSGDLGYNALVFNFTPVENATYTASVDGKRFGSVYGQIHLYLRNAADVTVLDATDPINGEEYERATTAALTADATVTKGVVAFEMGQGGLMTIDNFCLIEEIVFPVSLRTFEGSVVGKTNRLSWVTEQEENTEMFYLERSRNGQAGWTTIATQEAAGNSQALLTYSAVDERPAAQSYYRLRMVDFDGSTQLSEVVLLHQPQTAMLSAYPNPIADRLTLETKLDRPAEYRLLDVYGRTVRRGLIGAGDLRTTLQLDDIPAGQYIVRVGNETTFVIK